MDGRPAYWFPAKRYGWGWGPPVTWQGWVVTLLWGAAYLGGGVFIARRSMLEFAAFSLLMVAVIIAICLAKGEPPGWRWGDGPR